MCYEPAPRRALRPPNAAIEEPLGTLGILALLATFHLFPADVPQTEAAVRSSSEEGDAPPSDSSRGAGLLGVEQPLRRGETVGIDTPVGRVEVMLLWSDAQLQLGLLEEPLDEAVVGFAPAGVFSRKERPTGRLVVALPVLRF